MRFAIVSLALVALAGPSLLIHASPTRGRNSEHCARSTTSTVTVTATHTASHVSTAVNHRTVATTTVTAATSTDLHTTTTTVTTCLHGQRTVEKRLVPPASPRGCFGHADPGSSIDIIEGNNREDPPNVLQMRNYNPTISIPTGTVTAWVPGCLTAQPEPTEKSSSSQSSSTKSSSKSHRSSTKSTSKSRHSSTSSSSTIRHTSTVVKTTSHTVTPICTWIATHTVTIHKTVTHSPVVTSMMKATVTATHTPSTKATTTKTVTSIVCSAPPACTNQGLQWAYYPSEAGPNFDNEYSNFNPVLYKTQWPRDQGITHSIGGISYPIADSEKFIQIYDSPNDQFRTYFALNHKGYIYALTTGTYTFTASSVDDTVYLWLGAPAYSGWDVKNANLHVSWVQQPKGTQGNGRPGSGSATFYMVGGEYYAFRIMYGQAQTAAEFMFQVRAPDGSVFLDSESEGSPYVVQYSCDGGKSAPPFGFFGSENDVRIGM